MLLGSGGGCGGFEHLQAAYAVMTGAAIRVGEIQLQYRCGDVSMHQSPHLPTFSLKHKRAVLCCALLCCAVLCHQVRLLEQLALNKVQEGDDDGARKVLQVGRD